ncbi:hypothetical protein HARCEL1_00780 [Halococcoides cellulosivorans]|uniref:Uncharacterized protein n=1 Tax=Halococcoides cellulosivorans TaxID=1679096 RepID=A0A2R4X468_9EURY|nr:hypothetical protein HARCEL1_00780 [Halococcoides cellulosivorans]
MLQTNKWASDIDLTGDGMHDFKHVVARHAHPDADGDWPVQPGSEIEQFPEEAFPKEVGPGELKDAIEITVRRGNVGDDAGELVYSGSSLDRFGVDEITIRRNPKTGVIQTVYPSGDAP